MTETTKLSTGALEDLNENWDSINWKTIYKQVNKLQMRIAKAYREGRYGKVKSLQWILTHSFYAKLIAVRRVVQNKGGRTPGVDNIVWRTRKQKMHAAKSLRRKGYKAQPLKRVYISKKPKGYRPLSIPAMKCRAMQALYLLALEPITEIIADKNSYGFRPYRSAADAIGQCFIALSLKCSAQYILEADIKSCFDSISHTWLLNNVPMDKRILNQWLLAGYIQQGKKHSIMKGTPQGGIISPTILNVVLSGLESTIKRETRPKDKVNVCIYADDFIITGNTREILENKVKPIVEKFLGKRGLVLSKDKTQITHIDKGFDFLSINIRKYNGKLIMKPTKESVKKFLKDTRKVIKSNAARKTEELISQLNPKIIGWANYYSHVCSKNTFKYVDNCIYDALWRWAARRHPKKNARWVKAKYFKTVKKRNWAFAVQTSKKDDLLLLAKASYIPITRHIKVKAEATPYNPEYKDYLWSRIKQYARQKVLKQAVAKS